MVFALVLRYGSLMCFASFASEPLSTNLETARRLDSEKVSAGAVASPVILVRGKPFKRKLIVFRSEGGVAFSNPIDETTATLRRVYLDLQSGGLYLEDPNHPEALKKKDKTRFLRLQAPEKSERQFIRQFAYFLQQRHSTDPSTAKFFQFYFGISDSEDSPSTFDKEFLLSPRFSKLQGLESASAAPPNLETLFDFMANPDGWTGLECTTSDGAPDGKRCRYEHATRGQILLEHPGAADLVFDDSELFDPKEALPVEAPVVSSRPELEKVLAEQPADVTTALVLVTHEECGPCLALKNPGGLWGELCQRLRRKNVPGVAAFAEVAATPNFAPSPLMSDYSLPRGFPQLLVFRRVGSGWGAPQRYSAGELQEQLRLQQKN